MMVPAVGVPVTPQITPMSANFGHDTAAEEQSAPAGKLEGQEIAATFETSPRVCCANAGTLRASRTIKTFIAYFPGTKDDWSRYHHSNSPSGLPLAIRWKYHCCRLDSAQSGF